MTLSMHALMADSGIVALTLRQPLASVEAPDVPVAPPTYPPSRETGAHRFDTPLPRERDPRRGAGVRARHRRLAGQPHGGGRSPARSPTSSPRHVVRAGSIERDLTALPPPHRRCGDSRDRTGALYSRGVSRRSTRATPRRWPASPPHRSSTGRGTRATPAFASRASSHRASARTTSRCSPARRSTRAPSRKRPLGLDDRAWKRAAAAGLAPTPRVDRPGRAFSSAAPSRSRRRSCSSRFGDYREGSGSHLLCAYLLGLALGGLVTGGRRYRLRSGCALVPAGAPEWRAVRETGERTAVDVDADALVAELRETARAWSAVAGGRARGGRPSCTTSTPSAPRAMLGAKAAEEETP